MATVVIFRGSAVVAAAGEAGGRGVEGTGTEGLARDEACGSLVAFAVPWSRGVPVRLDLARALAPKPVASLSRKDLDDDDDDRRARESSGAA